LLLLPQRQEMDHPPLSMAFQRAATRR
jgi:hypothetical protein